MSIPIHSNFTKATFRRNGNSSPTTLSIIALDRIGDVFGAILLLNICNIPKQLAC